MARWPPLVVGWVALVTSGCGLIPIPYVADVTGSITGLRVLDEQTNKDIPGACASFQTGISMTNWLSACPPMLSAVRERPGNAVSDEGHLLRDTDGVFRISRRRGLGFVRPWGIGPLGIALYNPPIGVVRVSAPGYPQATLLYYVGARPDPGWIASATVFNEHSASDGAAAHGDERQLEAARCELEKDGILRFSLRQETADASADPIVPLPGG
jgi:hypothetical protein